MIRLRTLGALDLRSADGTEAQSVLRQPKRFALLAYLAIARPRGFQRRDRVLLTFWPELDRDRARGALNQSVFILRQALGRDIVVNRGDEEIGIGADTLWCDAVAFDEAIERGDLEEALSLYQGELLAGFHVDEAADFERWLDEERAQRAQRAAEAAWTLAERAGMAGDIAGARDLAARAISFGPWDERGLRRLMMLLDGAGDRAGAIAAFHDFARRLRTDLEIDPSAETLELVEAIKARAEPNGGPEPAPIVVKAPAPTVESDRAAAMAAASATVTGPTGVVRAVRWAVHHVRWSTVVLVLFFGALAAFIALRPPDPSLRIAVLPVRDESPGEQYGHITGALTSAIIQTVHHPGRLNVVSEFGVRSYADENPTPAEVARRLDVGYIVSGVLTGSDERIKVTLELIDAETGELVDVTVVDKAGSDWLAFSEQVGDDLASTLRAKLGEEYLEAKWRSGTSSEPAWTAVARANELLRTAAASERHPGFEHSLRLLDEAEAYANKARGHDPAWSEPLAMLARIFERRGFYSLYDATSTHAERAASFDTAEAYADSALALSEGDAEAWELRGTVRHRRYLFATPPVPAADSLLDAAEQDLRKALDLEPLRARAASTLSYVLFAKGRLEDARRYALTAFDNDAFMWEMSNVANHLFAITFHQGDDDEASRWCDEVGRRMPDEMPHGLCKLILLSWSRVASNSAKSAYVELATFASAASPEERMAYQPCALVLAAPAVARDDAFGPDSARALIDRARAAAAAIGSDHCREYEAAALAAIGDVKGALAALDAVLERYPAAMPRLRESRFFKALLRQDMATTRGANR